MYHQSLFLQTSSRFAVILPARYDLEVSRRPGPRLWSFEQAVLKLVLIVQPRHFRPGRPHDRASGDS
jgi:hypothetical protein